MSEDIINYAKYTRKDCNTLKDGHVMFPEDIIKDLNRKSYLESLLKSKEEEIDDLSQKLGICEGMQKTNMKMLLEKDFMLDMAVEFITSTEIVTNQDHGQLTEDETFIVWVNAMQALTEIKEKR